MFKHLLNERGTSIQNKDVELFASREGIRHSDEVLNWDDAERILKQLEEV